MNHRLSQGIAALYCAALLLAPASTRAQTNSASAADTPPPEAASPSTAALINSMDALNDTTKLSNGDHVSYRVVEEKKDPISLTVTDSGELEIPLLGLYPATGKTCKQLAYELKPLLEKDYFYKATVIVGLDVLSTRPRGKVFIMGQVHAQGAIDIPADGNLTVSRVILLDGGLADFADRRRVKLMHKNADGSTETTIVDLVEVLDHGHADKDPVVQPGDTINVPEKLINF
ncbi:MAG TPA: polysaccharide biosynthesis/export family protein [Candidatus Methylacidiphilales bacterium]|nr:polysaccharide biosynthesis/export family protein [Candidatus Methylacidiphilales bacterium]